LLSVTTYSPWPMAGIGWKSGVFRPVIEIFIFLITD
jgi:hypothetical protein